MASFLAAATILAVSLGGSAWAKTTAQSSSAVSVIDDVGQHIHLAHPATRIVAIEPSNSEIVLDLGLRSDLVGVDQSALTYTPQPWLGRLKGVHSIGNSYPAVSEESVVAARPNLVLTGSGVGGLGGLHALGIPVVVLNPQSVNGVYHDILLVGRLTGTLSRARQLVAHMRHRVAQIAAAVKLKAKTRPTVFYDLGGLYTAGPKSFIDNLISLAGGVNIADRYSHAAYPQMTAEQVVAANPDYIVVDPQATTVKQEDKLPGFSSLTAVKEHHVIALPNSSYTNEPSLALVLGLRELVGILHPSLSH